MKSLISLRGEALLTCTVGLLALGCSNEAAGQPGGGEVAGAAGSAAACGDGRGGSSTGGVPAVNGYSRNPFVSHIFTADPSAKIFDGRV